MTETTMTTDDTTDRQYSLALTKDEFAKVYAATALASGMTLEDKREELCRYVKGEFEAKVDDTGGDGDLE